MTPNETQQIIRLLEQILVELQKQRPVSGADFPGMPG
jgi:hypothetical protein